MTRRGWAVAGIVVAAAALGLIAARGCDDAATEDPASVAALRSDAAPPARAAAPRAGRPDRAAEPSAEEPPDAPPAAGAVEGVVRTEDGRPAAGVPVRLGLGRAGLEARIAATSADDGSFRFADVPAGTLARLWVDDGGRWAPAVRDDYAHESLGDDSAELHGLAKTLRAGETWRRDLVAERRAGADTVFELRFPAGVPAPDTVEVRHVASFLGGDASSTTTASVDAAAPRVERFLAVGRHRVSFAAPAVRTRQVEVEVAEDGATRTVVVELERAPALDVRARVVLPDGVRTAPGDVVVTVAVVGPTGGTAHRAPPLAADGTTDLSDLLRAHPLPDGGELRLWADGPGLFRHARSSKFPDRVVPAVELSTADAGATRPIVLEVPARASVDVLVRVRDGEDRPVPGVVLDLSGGGFAAEEAVGDAAGEAVVALVAERAGTPPAPPRVVARPPYVGHLECGLRALHESLRREGDRWVGTLTVTATREIRCVLLRADGTPVAGAKVRTSRGAHRVTDAAGRWDDEIAVDDASFRPLVGGWFTDEAAVPPGAAEVHVVAYARRRVTVTARGAAPDVRRGGARFRVAGGGREHSVALLGEDVLAGALDLPERELDYEVHSDDARSVARGRLGPGERTLDVVLAAAPLHAFELTVADGTGAPVADLLVNLGVAGRAAARTDASGVARFELTDVAATERAQVHAAQWDMAPEHVAVVLPSAEHVAVVARPRVTVRIVPAARRPARVQVVQVLADGRRLRAECVGGSESADERSLHFALPSAAPCTLEATVDGRSFAWPYDPRVPKELTATLE